MTLLGKLLDTSKLSPNRRKVIANVYWAVLGKIVNVISALVIGVLVARYLGPDNFGLMNYVISYVTLFSVVATFGLDSIEVRELSKTNVLPSTILGTAFALRLTLALGAILLILVTLWLFQVDAFTFSMVMLYSVSLVFGSLNVIRNHFTALVLNEYVVKTEISRVVVGSAIKAVLLVAHCSLAWFIAANAFEAVLIAAGYLRSYHKTAGLLRHWTFDPLVARMLIRESFPLLLSSAAVILYQNLDAVLIRHLLDNASVGQFFAATKVADIVLFVPMVISQTVTPFLVKTHEEDAARYAARAQDFLDLMVWTSVLMALAMSALADPAIRLLYGARYAEAIPVLQIMPWKVVFVALSIASGQLIIIQHLQRFAVLRNVLGCVVSVVLNLLLIPVWGIVGSAVAALLTMAVSGYAAHCFIRPYRYLIPLQTRALVLGWKRLLHFSLLRR